MNSALSHPRSVARFAFARTCFVALSLLATVGFGQGSNFTVTSTADDGSAGTLRWAIQQANAAGGAATHTIDLAGVNGTIALNAALPIVTTSVAISGSGASSLTISGNNANRVFFVDTATAGAAVNIQNLTIANGRAKGGDGGISGGGGLGAGGALFVNSGAVTLSGVAFRNNTAVGGNGGAGFPSTPGPWGGGGGGGLGGNGGVGGGIQGGTGGGGGGYSGDGGAGAPSSFIFSNGGQVGGGGGGGGIGDQTGGPGGARGNGGSTGGGTAGGAGSQTDANGIISGTPTGVGSGGTGGYANYNVRSGYGGQKYGGGGGASSNYSANGGRGGDFGGGGGAGYGGLSTAGQGGYGGGGGGAQPGRQSGVATAGQGGFGGGGGGAWLRAGTSAGYGGAGGFYTIFSFTDPLRTGGGGGGAALGGAIFVRAVNGATLTLADTDLDAGSLVPGQPGSQPATYGHTSATAGQGVGSALFLHGGTTQLGSGTLGGSIGATGIATLAKIGTGTLVALGAIDMNDGQTLISAGTLQIGNGGSSGTLAGNVTNNASLVFNRAGTITYGGVISGSGSLTQAGTGKLTLTGINTYSGGTTVSAGTLEIGDTTTGTITAGSIAGDITNNGALLFSSNLPATFAGVISGGGALTKSGNGVLTFSGANTFTGNTTISAGTLALGSGSGLGNAGTLSFTGGTLQFSSSNAVDYSPRFSSAANQNYRIDTNGQSVTFGSTLAGNGSKLNKLGSGTLTLEGANTFTGGATLTGGTLALGSIGALGTTGSIVFAGGTLQFSANNTTNYSPRFTTGSGQNFKIDTNGQAVTFASPLNSSGGQLTKLGVGTLTLTGVNSLSGGVTLGGGLVGLGSSGALGSSGTISFAGGGLQFTASSADYSARFSSASDQVYRFDTNGQSPMLASALISSGGSLVKTGAGTLTLAGNSTYSGTTTISAGTLRVGAGGTSGAIAGDVSVASGATLMFNRSNALTYAGAISGTGTLISAGPGTLTLSGTNTFTGGTTITGGTLTLSGGAALSDTGAVVLANTAGAALALTSNETVGSIAGGGTLGGGIALGANTLTIGGDNTSTQFSGIVSGSGGSLVKTGTGTLTLTGANTYTGGTTMSNGTLAVTSFTQLSTSGTISLAGGTLAVVGPSSTTTRDLNVSASSTLSVTNDLDYSGALSGAGTLTKSGGGTLTLSAINPAFSGILAVDVGAVKYGTSGALPDGNTVQIASGARLLLNGNDVTLASITAPAPGQQGELVFGTTSTLHFTGNLTADLTGSGTLIKTGSGASAIASPAGKFAGSIYVTAGSLLPASAATLTSGALNVGAAGTLDLLNSDAAVGTLTGSGNVNLRTHTLTLSPSASAANFSGVISGTGGVTQAASHTGISTLSGANTYTGPTTVLGGTLQFAQPASLYNGTPGNWTDTRLIVASGATAAFNLGGAGEFTLSDIATLAGLGSATGGFQSGALLGLDITNAGGSFTYGNAIANPNGGANALGLAKLGAGTLVLSGANTYTGATIVNGGTLALGADNALPAGTAVTVGGGATFDFNNYHASISALGGSGNVTLGSGNLGVSGNTSAAFSGVISGSGNLTKSGSGTLTLSGANTFTGTTRIASGTLALGSATTLASSPTLILDGGTLAIGGKFNPSLPSLSLLSTSTIDFLGNASALTFANIVRTGGTLTLDHWSGNPLGAGNSQLKSTAAPTGFSGGSILTEINFSGYGNGARRLGTGEIVPLVTSAFYTYALTGSGNWDAGASWSALGTATPGAAPSAAGDTVVLNGSATGPATVSLNGANRTLGYLTFDSAQNYTVTGHNLVFDVLEDHAHLIGTHTGSNTVTSGILLNDPLQVSQNGNGTLTLTGAIANNSGTNDLTFAVYTPPSGSIGTIAATGDINLGTGSLTKLGPGTLTLSGTNTYSGATSIQDGTLAVANLASLGTSPLTLGGSTGSPVLQLLASDTFNASHPVAITGEGGTLLLNPGVTATVTTAFTGTGNLTKLGAGTLFLDAANVATGNLTISAGTLKLGRADAVSAAKLTIADAGTLDFNGLDWSSVVNLRTGGSLANSSATAATVSGAIATDGAALTLSSAGGDLRLTGTIDHTVALTTNGTGRVALAAAPSAAVSQVTVNGRLLLENAPALKALATVVVNDTGALEVGGADAQLYVNQVQFNAHALTGDTGSLLNPTPNTTVRLDVSTSLSFAGSGAGATVLVGGAGNLQLVSHGALTGQIGLTKVGGGTLEFSAIDSSSWTAPIAVRAGTLLLGNAFDNAIAVSTGASLFFPAPGDHTYAGSFSGTGSFGTTSNSLLFLPGTSSFAGTLVGRAVVTGSLTAAASTFTLPAEGLILHGGTFTTAAALTSSRPLIVTENGGTLNAGAFDSTFSALNGIGGAFTKTGSGKLTLTGDSSFGGDLTVAAGSLQINPGASLTLGNLASTYAGTINGNVILNGALNFEINNHFTYAGNLSGTGVLNKGGLNTLTLSGTNTHSGGTVLTLGTLSVTADSQLGAASAPLTLDWGTLQIAGTTFGTSTRPVNLTTFATIEVTEAAATATFTGVMSGLGYLQKEGAGTLVLSGANTAQNEITLNAGTLRLGHALALQNSTVHVIDGTLDLNGFNATLGALNGYVPLNLGSSTLTVGGNGATTTYTAAISGTGALVKTGTGMLGLQSANTYSGGTTVNGGTLSIANDSRLGDPAGGLTLDGGTLRNTGTLNTARAVTLGTDGGTLDVFGNATFSGVISGSGSLNATFTNPASARTLTLSGSNTYTGGTTIGTNGTVSVSSDANLGAAAGAVTFAGGTLSAPAGFTAARATLLDAGGGTFNVASSQTLTWNGDISGATGNPLVKIGAGTLLLGGTNTYAGDTLVNVGTLKLNSAVALSPNTKLFVAAGAFFDANGHALTFTELGGTGTIDVGTGGLAIAPTGTTNFTGILGGAGGFTMNGTGTLVLGGANTYTGITDIQSGIVQLGVSGALPSGSTVRIETGANLNLNGYATTLGSLWGAGNLTNGGANLAIAQSEYSSFSGVLSGTGGLTKSGSGTVELTGTNTFSGATAINSGEIRLTGSAANSAFTLSGGILSGNGTVGALTIASGGTLAPGNSPGVIHAGTTTWAGGGTFAFEVNQRDGTAGLNPGWDLLAVSGQLNITATSGSKFTVGIATLNFANLVGVPENFASGGNYTFAFVTTTSGITGFSTSAFTLNTTNVDPSLTGTWSLALGNSNRDLNLLYTASAIPEPSTYAAILGALALAAVIYRRRK